MIDTAVRVLLQRNLPFTLVNYPDGQHAFDVEDDREESHQVFRWILAFAREHLLTA